jgi:hypothetical protein
LKDDGFGKVVSERVDGEKQVLKKLLCRPRNGLNDTLYQVEICRRYAERYGRLLIIDTKYGNCFSDEFSNYFISRDPKIKLTPKDILDHEAQTLHEFISRKNVSVFPEFLAENIDDYEATWHSTEMGFVEVSTGMQVGFDFETDYPHELLVHDNGNWDGRSSSVNVLAHLTLNERLAAEFLRRSRLMGKEYLAIHIRNTDYKTSYEEKLHLLRPEIEKLGLRNIFIATDNRLCLDYGKKILNNFNVQSFSRLPETAGQPTHYAGNGWRCTEEDHFNSNVDAIMDLILLAYSKKMYYLLYSGFSKLAEDLKCNESILHGLAPRDVL